MLTLSVVICAHNEQDWIGKTLESLLHQKRMPDEVVVVNNASSDNTAAVVQDFIDKHPQQRVLLVEEPRVGLANAREAGWRAASSEIIVMTDADMQFPTDWLQVIDRVFTEDSTLDAITGSVRYYDAHPIINWVTAITDVLFQPRGIGKFFNSQYTLNGGNSAYRRKVLEAVNGYVEKPYDMLEDRYMSSRIKEGGYKAAIVEDCVVLHTFRRFSKNGWRGYWIYMFGYTAENVYADHLSESSPYKVSILVPAYNEEKLIGRCLESILAQKLQPHEILVVDNNSTDRTVEIVKSIMANHPHVKLAHESKQGCVNARESGWRATTGDVVVHVDADEIFPEGWMERVHALLVVYPDVAAFGGAVRFENAPPHIWLIQVLYNQLYPRLIKWTKGFPYLTGGMTVCKREVLEKMNGYANMPNDQLDDYYLSGQAHRLGYKLKYDPGLYAIHSLRRYEAGGLKGFLQWGVGGLDAKKYEPYQP